MIFSWRSLTFPFLITATMLIAPSMQIGCINGESGSAANSCGNRSTIINNYIDEALNDTVRNLHIHGNNAIRVQDIDGNIWMDGIFTPINCHLKMTNGYFENLPTLKRKGDAYLHRTATNFTLIAAFIFDNAVIEYKNYTLSCLLNDMKGVLKAKLERLTIEIQLSVGFTQTDCHLTTDYVRVPDLENMEVSLTGLGDLNDAVSRFATSLMTMWKKDIMKAMENTLKDAIDAGGEEICDQNRDDILAAIYELDPSAHFV